MSDNIKAIETVYRGYRFRSRLEARWACFMDAAGVRWEYETEGYEVGGRRYLPDFYLPANRTFLEVKPARGEAVDEKPMAIVQAGGDVFSYDHPERRRMVVVYGDPMGADGDEIWWSVSRTRVIRCRFPRVCPTCKAMYFGSERTEITTTWRSECSCGSWQLPTWQAFVIDAALAARQARFEHGQHPDPVARLEHRYHDTAPDIYLAGKVRTADWRAGLGVPSGEINEKGGHLFEVGDRISAKYRSWTYNGPDLTLQHGEIDHGVASDCMRRVAGSNVFFAWIDSADTHGTLAELGLWYGLHGHSFVAFASDEIREELWFASRLATVDVVVSTVRQAWDAFVEWEEYGRCYLQVEP